MRVGMMRQQDGIDGKTVARSALLYVKPAVKKSI
jgi:hypothetical protein